MTRALSRLGTLARRIGRGTGALLGALRHDRSGVALVEFAYSLPILVTIGMGGTELANYATTKMRVSQLALAIADHGSRIGEDGVLQDIKIYESNINDTFIGANLQSGAMKLNEKGRVILTQLQTVKNPTTGVYSQSEGWVRCYGALDYTRRYAVQSDGMGEAGSRVMAANDSALMFAELAYRYEPFFPLLNGLNPLELTMVNVAAYTVRDDRDLTQVYGQSGVTPSSC